VFAEKGDSRNFLIERPVLLPNMMSMTSLSSQVNTLPNAKSQAKDKRANDRQKYAALRCKVGVTPPGFEVRRRMSRVAFRVFPAGRAGDTRTAICAITCFVSRFRVYVCM
jgi:hypothetical protein